MYICFGLIVGDFLISPIGVIDSSVLNAVGLLMKGLMIKCVLNAIIKGRSVKITKGDFSIEIIRNT